MKESYPVTKKGYELLKKELKQLLNTDRPAVVNAISTAREHGDLKENAEYHAAKEQQGFIEGRIQELNAKLANANVIDIEKLSGDKVVFGATVTFEDIDTEEVSNYQIVGEDESDIKQNKISVHQFIFSHNYKLSTGSPSSLAILEKKLRSVANSIKDEFIKNLEEKIYNEIKNIS